MHELILHGYNHLLWSKLIGFNPHGLKTFNSVEKWDATVFMIWFH